MRCKKCNTRYMNGDLFCRYCGVEVPEHEVITCDCSAVVCLPDRFCHECGTELEGLDESNQCECGAELAEDTKFCSQCGKKST